VTVVHGTGLIGLDRNLIYIFGQIKRYIFLCTPRLISSDRMIICINRVTVCVHFILDVVCRCALRYKTWLLDLKDLSRLWNSYHGQPCIIPCDEDDDDNDVMLKTDTESQCIQDYSQL